jgi:hypothetical protein
MKNAMTASAIGNAPKTITLIRKSRSLPMGARYQVNAAMLQFVPLGAVPAQLPSLSYPTPAGTASLAKLMGPTEATWGQF